MSKIILQLCADTGSDTKPYRDAGYDVRCIGKEIGVENYTPPDNVYGIIANPVCTELSIARSGGRARDPEEGMFLVRECQRIIKQASPHFWIIENPATGALKEYLGPPRYKYQPWYYGSPWTKETALWGEFNIPERIYHKWEDVSKLTGLYTKPGRGKPSMAHMHHSHIKYIPEFNSFKVDSDAEFRSLCSQKFATALFNCNR